MSVTFEATLRITLWSLAFQEVAGSFCPSLYNAASFGVWVWMRRGPPLPPHTLQGPKPPVAPGSRWTLESSSSPEP